MTITYEQNGDYLLPNILSNEEPEEVLTNYGLMRKNYLKEHHGGIYQSLLIRGTLKQHLLEVQEQAQERVDCITRQMCQTEGVDNMMKTADQMLLVQKMNMIRLQAEEIVLKELVYV